MEEEEKDEEEERGWDGQWICNFPLLLFMR